MKRRLSFLLAVLIAFALFAGAFPQKASAESLYIRKIVSVVYDDSGSMTDSANWAYANYATQAFCGLLNSNDRLFITYMSEASANPKMTPREMDLSSGKIQQSVDSIRTHDRFSDTPYASVDIAFRQLLNTPDDEPNTEYWLVIFTDGAFQDNNGYGVNDAELTKRMSAFTSTQMPNGSYPQVSYFAIGKNAPKPAEDRSRGIYVYESAGAKDIVNVMADVASRVSGRSLLDKKDIHKKGNDTVEITSTVPLLNIAVLSQNSDIHVEEITYKEDGGSLYIDREVSVHYPEIVGLLTDDTLLGGAFLLNNRGKNISAGTYTIRFSGKVNPKNLVIMFEPALELRMCVYLNGAELDLSSDLGMLHEGDLIDVVFRLYEIGTGVEVPVNLLPADTAFHAVVEENGAAVLENRSPELTLEGVELHNRLTEITAEVEIKGSSAIRLTTGLFTPAKPVVYSIGIEAPDNFSMTMDELRVNTRSIRFVIYENGLPLGADKTAKLPFTVETLMPGKVEIDADGAVCFTPLYRDPITTIPTGTVEVTGVLTGIASVTTSLYVKPVEYEIRAVGVDADAILRSDLKDNRDGARFQLFADGVRLGKAAVEAADLDCRFSGRCGKRLVCVKEVDAGGELRLIPRYEKCGWLIPYLVPTGTLTVSCTFSGSSDKADISITNDWLHELIFNYLIPAAVLALILGHLIKKRFVYSNEIAYNVGSSTGSIVSGPVNGWNTQSLRCWSALIPFVADFKYINGVCFHACGRLGSRKPVRIKCSKLSPASGMLENGLNDMHAVRFRKSDVMTFEKSQWKTLMPHSAFVSSADASYSACQVFLYKDSNS